MLAQTSCNRECTYGDVACVMFKATFAAVWNAFSTLIASFALVSISALVKELLNMLAGGFAL